VTHTLSAWNAPTADGPVRAVVCPPGSKSMMARALVLAAVSEGASTLRRPLRARDSELMAAGLSNMGVEISTVDDDVWTVSPAALRGPAHIDVGIAGTVMRFMPPVAALARGLVTFDGDPRARSRPMGPLLRALADIGARIDASPASDGGALPMTVHGAGSLPGGEVVIDASSSSQLVSGLLLAAARYDNGLVVRHSGPPVPSAPHLRMTVAMLRTVGAIVDDSTLDVWAVEPGSLRGHDWQIEPDLSGAAPFLAAAMVTGGEVTVPGWPERTTQPGDHLREILAEMGGQVRMTSGGLTVRGGASVHGIKADLSEVSELTPVIAALAAVADSPSTLTGVAHIRGHETDRISALAAELSRLGAGVAELDDGLRIEPRPLRGAVFQTYDDHRMAHAAAVIGLTVDGVQLSDVACTSKTMPDFPALWEGLARTDSPDDPEAAL
jgi:3-phosphoshikimate 1-carboxyvinyltransferase